MNYNEASQELTQHLKLGESLAWSGRPRQGLIFRSCDWFLIPFSLIWGGGGFMSAFIFFHQPMIGQQLAGALGGLLGMYAFFGRYVYDIVRRKKTVYGITKDRILIQSSLFNKQIQSISLSELSSITLNTSGNGKGNIVLGEDNSQSDIFRSFTLPRSLKRIAPALEGLPDAPEVLKLIESLRKG